MTDRFDLGQLQELAEPIFQTLRPYTRQLPLPIRAIGENLLGKDIFDALIIDLDPFSPRNELLLKMGVSKVLGLGLISASSMVKLPQIINIIRTYSVDGLSLLSYVMELISFVIQLCFNYRMGNPFQTYGETLFIALQNSFIVLLIMNLRGLEKYFPILLLLGGWLVFGLLSSTEDKLGFSHYLVDNEFLSKAYLVSIPLAIMSKIPQIMNNFRNKSTGQLSSVSVIASLLGSLARIFTSFTNNITDSAVIYGYLAAGVVNLILGLQLIMYARRRVSKSKKNN